MLFALQKDYGEGRHISNRPAFEFGRTKISMSKIQLNTFAGSVYHCGEQYGLEKQADIAAFFSKEFSNYKYSKTFVSKCRDKIKRYTPRTYEFLRGMVSNSMLSMEQHVLLMLHEEELYHRQLARKAPHCTVIGLSYRRGKEKNTLIGENWDWNTSYLPFGSFSKFSIGTTRSFIALSFPGLPVCAGINSQGLALMWTGLAIIRL